VYIRLVKVKSAGIGHSDTMRVGSLSTLEAETNPILLTDIGTVKWKIYLVDRTLVLR
jgi:hypothetical protein